MKTRFLSLVLLSALTFNAALALADVTVIKTKVTANAVEIPNGTIQLIDPKVTILGTEYSFGANHDTARIVCYEFNKMSSRGYQVIGSKEKAKLVYFDSSGAMSFEHPDQMVSQIHIVTCVK